MDGNRTLDNIIDECIERLLRGESLDALLSEHPEHARELEPALQSAAIVIQTPVPDASPAGRARALHHMFNELANATTVVREERSWLRSFRGRPLAFQALALAGAFAIFGGLGIGASAATGTTPEPVQRIFGISSNSTIKVELQGTILAADLDMSTLSVDANGDVRAVVVTSKTRLLRGNNRAPLNEFAPGQMIEVKGALQADNSILASRIKLEDDIGQPQGPPDSVPPARVPTIAPPANGPDRPMPSDLPVVPPPAEIVDDLPIPTFVPGIAPDVVPDATQDDAGGGRWSPFGNADFDATGRPGFGRWTP